MTVHHRKASAKKQLYNVHKEIVTSGKVVAKESLIRSELLLKYSKYSNIIKIYIEDIQDILLSLVNILSLLSLQSIIFHVIYT